MKSIVRLALIAVGTLISAGLSAQSFSEYSSGRGKAMFEESVWEFYLRHTNVSGKYTEKLSGNTVNIGVRRDVIGKGEVRWRYENPTLGDMIFLIGYILKGDKSRTTEQSFGGGWLGWFQTTVNVVSTDRLILSPGLSYGDYIYGTKRAQPPAGYTTHSIDPGGYYFHVGPAFLASYAAGKSFWLDAYVNYDIGAWRAGKVPDFTEIPGYPKPHFFVFSTSIRHAKSKLMANVRFNKFIDRGITKDSALRTDISLGYMF